MKNLLNPLKKILTSLTGEETKDKNIVAVVDKIADAVEDNTKINDGGVSFFDVHISYDEETGPWITETFEEIATAYNSGKFIRPIFVNQRKIGILTKILTTEDPSYNYAVFHFFDYDFYSHAFSISAYRMGADGRLDNDWIRVTK